MRCPRAEERGIRREDSRVSSHLGRFNRACSKPYHEMQRYDYPNHRDKDLHELLNHSAPTLLSVGFSW